MSLLDKLRNTFKGANRTSSKNKSKGSSSTVKTKKKETKKSEPKKSSTKSQNGSTTQNRGSQGVNRSESKATTKATQPKNNTPSNTGWSDYVKEALSSREAYRENVRKQAQQNANKNAPTKPKNAYEQRVAKQEAKDKKYYGMTRAGQLGATAEDKVQANKQSAVANTQLHKNHKFVAGVLDNVLPSAWDTTEFGDKNYYTDEQKKQIKKSQDSGAYKAGALVGTGIQFAAPAGAAKAVGKGAIKGGSKLAKGAKAVGLESAFNTPLNAVQAVKESRDENGKVDKKEFAKSLALNTALDVGIGGAAEGVGAAMAKKNAKKLIKLQTKANNGEVLTKDEKRELVKLYDDMEAKAKDKSNVSSETAENALKEANAEINLSKVTSGNKPAKDIKTITREEAVASDKEAKIPETLTEREKKEYRYLRDKKETQKLTKRERNRLRELQNGGKANIKEASENALTLNEGRELARIKGREKAGTLSEADTIRMRQLEAKIEAKRNADNVMAESGEALQKNLDDLDNQIETVDNLATGKTEEMPTGTNEMPTEKVESYKSVGVGTEHPSNMTDEQLGAELKKIDIIRSKSSKKNGGLSENQKIRDARAEELRAEAEARGIDVGAQKKVGASDDVKTAFDNTSHSERLDFFVNNAEKYGVDISDDLKAFVDNDILDEGAYTLQHEAAERIYKKVGDAITKASGDNKKVKDYFAKSEVDMRAEGTVENILKNAEKGEVSGKEIADFTVSEKKFADAKVTEDRLMDNFLVGKKATAKSKKEATEALTKARTDAEKNVNDLYSRVMGRESALEDTINAQAERAALMEKLAKDGDSERLLDVLGKDIETAELNGNPKAVTKGLKETTPEGRVRYLVGVGDRLTEAYEPRLKGKKIELAKDDVTKILNAKTEEEYMKAMDDAYAHMWDNIDATWFEKWNELRHFSMLANVKTHLRNVVGNTVYKQARQFAEIGEVALSKNKYIQKRLSDLGGESHMVNVSVKELKENKKTIDDIFDKMYKESGSQSRYKETVRPDGSKTFKSKILNKLTQFNYDALEWEDVQLALRPTYRKNFMRYVKSKGDWDIKNLSEEQISKASEWALQKAEEATFRDASALASKITKLKTATAGKKGKTAIGTAGYRAANIALESSLPFVKTPINIAARSIDYSPVGLIKGAVGIASAKDAETFLKSLHSFCTGTTGTFVASMGALMASQGLITVKAGEYSGDAYFDRDAGFQDYSLVVGDYSITIDWLAPMQSSLFMGASMFQNMSEKNDQTRAEDVFDMMLAMSGPMLDMSFMSGTKDTIDTFMEKVYRDGTGDDANWSGAMMQMVLGSVPQNYIGSFIPQVFSQAAQTSDKYQRDTRSTNADTLKASWERFGRQSANKIPCLRQAILNPKVDRRGELVTGNGSNIVTRFINSAINPANVKKITLTDTDRELIKIYNEMPEGKDKKYFFYNFTGNPDMDLGDGKRMTYDQLYKYGKEKRSTQYEYIKDMIASDRYGIMPNEMKAEEVDKYHWISNNRADIKTLGYKGAAKRILDQGTSYAEKLGGVYKEAKMYAEGGKNVDKDFVNAYVMQEEIQAMAHTNSDYHVKALALCSSPDYIQRAFDIHGEKIETAKKYLKDGGSVAEFTTGYCEGIAGCTVANVSTGAPNRSRAMADYDNIPERAYRAMGYDWNHAQAGAGLKKYNYTMEEVNNLKVRALMNFDGDASGTLKKDEAIAFVESLNCSSDDEKACVFATISSANNPYGTIKDHLEWGTEPDESGSGRGRRGRRGHGRRGHGGGGSGSGANDDWYAYLKGLGIGESASSSSTKVHDFTKPSKLDEAYRKRVRKLM